MFSLTCLNTNYTKSKEKTSLELKNKMKNSKLEYELCNFKLVLIHFLPLSRRLLVDILCDKIVVYGPLG